MPRRLTYLGLGVAVLAIGVGGWRLHALGVQSRVLPTKAASLPPPAPPSASLAGGAPTGPTVDPREARRKATDYLQLVRALEPLASQGSASAQYELASALRYCDDNWHERFFSHTTGVMRTSEEMDRLYAKLPENTRSLLESAHQRCHAFSDNLALLKTYSAWLDEAAKAGYPPAIFMKADMTMKAHLLDGDGAAIEQAKQQAISAVSTSADPEILFGMADFVDYGARNHQQVGQLISAWWLLACQSGYDCGPESEAAQSSCTVDPQCADKPTVIEELQRSNGAQFGEVEQLADQIRAAIDSHDSEAIKKYL